MSAERAVIARSLLVVLLAGVGLSPAAHAQDGAPPPAPADSPAAQGRSVWRIGDDLASTRWRLAEMDGALLAPETAPTLDFLPDLQVRGTSGCRRFVGPFESRADKGVFGPLRASQEACAGELEGQDGRFLERLQNVWIMRLEDAGRVLLAYPRGDERPLRFERLG